MRFSILIPSLLERQEKLAALLEELEKQCPREFVEILVLQDNRKRSTGLKRQVLLDMAQGDYVAFLDDDDFITPIYMQMILPALEAGSDVVSFNSLAFINQDDPFVVRTGLNFENEQAGRDSKGQWVNITRKPWHWCVWRSEVAKLARFPDAYVDDDWYWLRQIIPQAKTETHIDQILHVYRYSSEDSASNQGESVTDGML